jgi:hypothetical protein
MTAITTPLHWTDMVVRLAGRSIAITSSCFEEAFCVGLQLRSGKASIADHSLIDQRIAVAINRG